ncbi:MAG: hydrogenase maturation protein HypF [Acidimicrobiia bacterium]|nr:hydrogenase maturation protein HypF [Acidimicrobiia bacterium]
MQGVGFRPHVHALATQLRLRGWVENTEAGVEIAIEGPADAVEAFVKHLVSDAPPLAQIDALRVEPAAPVGAGGFLIRPSRPSRQAATATATALVSPDVATCEDCLAEMADPSNRRHGYPFTNCTNCGPRYTIVTGVPYDRPNTTMHTFSLCDACLAEYDDPTDRRFHAQPVCCPRCGPTLDLRIEHIAAALLQDGIVALKGLGGYHLAALASSDAAVRRLRTRKHRDDKPFALMVADLEAARALCRVGGAEAQLLSSPAHPIVLLDRLDRLDRHGRSAAAVASATAPGSAQLGIMLPYTGLHHLLLAAVGQPIVLTSGNLSDEPIAYRDDDAAVRLGPVADRIVGHDRPIHIRVDDSVARVVDGQPYLLRRSRGYAPAPVAVAWPFARPVLACGAELKSTIALARGRHVFLSHHLGDLKNYETYAAFCEAIEHVGRLFQIEPEVVAHDLHPSYLSTVHAVERDGVDRVAVQHHHAHIVSCLADNDEPGPVIGVAFDGAGHGSDGTVWGGELLVADLVDFERMAWLATVPLPGGDAAVKQPWRMAAAYLHTLGEAGAPPPWLAAQARWGDVVELARTGLRSPLTSSVGRLFDAVAALLDVRTDATYEGQAAVELEQRVDPDESGAYPARVVNDRLIGSDLVAGVLEDVRAGVEPGRIAARFHRGLAEVTATACELIRDRRGLDTVALSGGVFLNMVLLRQLTERLQSTGFRVLRHRRVPTNDGGISLGQAVVAGARDRLGGPARCTS